MVSPSCPLAGITTAVRVAAVLVCVIANRMKLRKIHRDFTMRRVVSAIKRVSKDELFNVSPSLVRDEPAEQDDAEVDDWESDHEVDMARGHVDSDIRVDEEGSTWVTSRLQAFRRLSLDHRIFQFLKNAEMPRRFSESTHSLDEMASERSNLESWASIADSHGKRTLYATASGFLNSTEVAFEPTLFEKISACFVPDLTRKHLDEHRETNLELGAMSEHVSSRGKRSSASSDGSSHRDSVSESSTTMDDGESRDGCEEDEGGVEYEERASWTYSERLEDAWLRLQFLVKLLFYRTKLYFLLFLRQVRDELALIPSAECMHRVRNTH